MGSKGGDQTIGYKYYLGIDFAWCHAPVDRCTALFVDNRQVFRGCFDEGQTIEIDKPELFGEFEGGISGFVDLEVGGETQTANTYTVSQTGEDTPAYRGVTRTVFRGQSEDGSSRSCYLGNNPYLKKITGEFQRIYKRIVDGAVTDQWQNSIAGIPLIDPDPTGLEFQTGTISNQSIFINVDLSSSSNGYAGDDGNITGNGLGIASMKQAIINSLIDIRDRFTLETPSETDFQGNETSGTSGLDIGIGYVRFTNGAKNNTSNNPNNVDPYYAPLEPGIDVDGLWGVDGGSYDLPQRGWMMKESATKSDIDDLISFVNDFVVVPDTVGNSTKETRELMRLLYENVDEAFDSITSNEIRGHVVYSGFVTDESESTISNYGELIDNILLETAATGEQPIKAAYGPGLSAFNDGGTLGEATSIGDNGNGNPAAVSVTTSPIGSFKGDRWDFDTEDSGWYLIADQGSSPWDGNALKQTTGNTNPYEPGDRILVDNPAGGSTTADYFTGPGPNDQLWIWGPLKTSGIYVGRFDVVEHWGRDVTGKTDILLGPEQRVWAPFHEGDKKFTLDYSSGTLEDGDTSNGGSAGMFTADICGNYVEMNPAHIIRECLTDQQWGLGLAESEIDETSFAAAAQTLYDEFFGLSIAWTRETPIEDFINVVLNHIDAVLYVDRTDGLWHLVLIRDDYDPDTIDSYTDADVVDWSNISIKSPAELVNSVTVKYNNRQLDGEASLTVNNLAQIQKLGKVIHTTVNYPGIWQDTLATRVAQRDLITLSTSLIGGEIVLTRKAYDLSPGDVFKLTSSRYNLSGEVMRVVEVNVGDGRQNGVRVKFTQDKYNFDYSESTDLVNAPDSEFSNPGEGTADTVEDRLVTEEPYYLFVERVGEIDAEDLEANEQTLGFGFVSAVAPTTKSVYSRIYYDDGSGYKNGRQVSYGPEATLGADLWEQADLETLTLSNFKFYEDLSSGDLIQIDDEIMRIDSIDSTTQVTVSRGALDTVPDFHNETQPVFFISQSNGRILGDYVDSDTIDVKLIDNTGNDALDPSLAPVDTLTLDSRITRPYPVGQLKLDGEYRTVYDTSTGNTIEATWVHRDRTLQNTDDAPVHTDASVGPETSNNYTITAVAYDYNGDEITSIGNLFSVDKNQDTSHTFTPSDYTAESEGTVPWSAVGVRVKTTREESTSEEYDNWQTPEVIAFTPADPTTDLYLYSAAWVDVNQLSSVYEENERQTNVTADGDPIGAMDNVKEDF